MDCAGISRYPQQKSSSQFTMRDISEGQNCNNDEHVDLPNFHCLWNGGDCDTFNLNRVLCSGGGSAMMTDAGN